MALNTKHWFFFSILLIYVYIVKEVYIIKKSIGNIFPSVFCDTLKTFKQNLFGLSDLEES